MSLIWFEGFETCGDELGSANAATVRPRIDHRIFIPTDTGTGSVWLVDSEEVDGFALSLGSAFNNRAIRDVEDTVLDGSHTGATAPIVTLGARIHLPDPLKDQDVVRIVVDNGDGSGAIAISARVSSTGELIFRRGNASMFTVASVFNGGEWYYVELSVRADGGFGNYATALVDSEPTDSTSFININSFAEYLPIWRVGTTYNENDEIRYLGRAYRCDEATSTGDYPDDNPAIWEDIGHEDDNTSVTPIVGQRSFYVLEDPDRKNRVSLSVSGGPPPTDIALNNAWDSGTGEYTPQPGDTIILGMNPFYEIRVNGQSVIRTQRNPSEDNGTLSFNNWRQMDRAQFSMVSSISGADANFFAIDDVYMSTTTEGARTNAHYEPDYYGPGKIISIPPESDIVSNWTPSTGSDHFALVNENGADDTTHLEASSNGLIDRFGHEDSAGLDGDIHAVRIEVEAINTDSGTPGLEVSMGSSGEISDNFTVDNTSDYEVFTLDSVTKPGGGAWDFTALDGLVSGIESSGL